MRKNRDSGDVDGDLYKFSNDVAAVAPSKITSVGIILGPSQISTHHVGNQIQEFVMEVQVKIKFRNDE